MLWTWEVLFNPVGQIRVSLARQGRILHVLRLTRNVSLTLSWTVMLIEIKISHQMAGDSDGKTRTGGAGRRWDAERKMYMFVDGLEVQILNRVPKRANE